MSRNRRLFKKIPRTYRKLFRAIASAIRKQKTWLLRTLWVTKSPRKSANSGFVLPTVAMVSLVVVLLTVAILFRSFERSKNASNVRVNEAVLSSAMPAIDRARAKIDELLKDPRLPRSTPSDFSLGQVLEGYREKFTFGDETPLTIVAEVNQQPGIQAGEDTLTSAWKYPVDTNNDGKFDSYTIYGIYYRTPSNNRQRGPVEARTRPMDEGAKDGQCESEVATSANLVGTQGWYKIGGKLKRSFFVYTTTVPITDKNLGGIPAAEKNKYQVITGGNKGFTALEYQQDRERIPLNNNAVLYEDDLEIAPGAGINLNGRIFTNGNLLTRQPFDPVRFYLVSSDKSCYYNEENSKIVIAGNVIKSRVNESSANNPTGDVRVDLFSKPYSGGNDSISNTNSTVPRNVFGSLAAYNDEAYVRRIERLVQATIANFPNRDQLPTEVREEIRRDEAEARTFEEARERQLKIYFRKRTRRVPYAEVPVGGDALGTYRTNSPLQGSGDSLRPVDAWVFPFNPNDGITATGFANIGINANGNDKIHLRATDPDEQVKLNEERLIGDRILVGNNMPQLWWDNAKQRFVGSPDDGQAIRGRKWDSNDKERKRFSQAYQLDDLGITERNGFWELSAAQRPQGELDVVGGMRVVTGAGIYLPNSVNEGAGSSVFASLGTTNLPPVWPDSMAMIPPGTAPADLGQYGINNPATPYLRMRASVAYHYKQDTYDPGSSGDVQTPIACISSFYDPSNSTTARNRQGLPNVELRNTPTNPNRNLTGLPLVAPGSGGNSHNGVVYPATGINSAAITTYRTALENQANLKYPNGKLVNEPLNKAMAKIANNGALTLEEQSAIDSAICALRIFDNTIGTPSDAVIPHGTIMETTFLDARQVKAIDKLGSNSATRYNLDVELRQPLEIRATMLDMDLLRRKAIQGDFLLPNSGIIYATRDDAIPDKSNPNSADISATDFRLDPNRRPNGIMLVNGSDLSRNQTYKPEEKGLILASNLPVYVKAENVPGQTIGKIGFFNRHTEEEFTDIKLKERQQWGNDFYSRAEHNPQFACRRGQLNNCTTGETWRPASIIADAITILSANFREGYRNEGDYELRDNWGYSAFGYNYTGNFTETDLQIDLDGNGSLGTSPVTTLNEVTLNADLNGDGNVNNTAVPVSQANLPAVVAARINGFWDNNFVTSFPWQDNVGAGGTSGRGFPSTLPADPSETPQLIKSSYFNNFVTPIQRRGDFSEYVMEICRKATVAACTPSDWRVGYDANNDGKINWNNPAEGDIRARIQSETALELPANDDKYTVNRLGAGTTARPALNPEDRRYPRRVAFLRDQNGNLVLSGGMPIPLGVIGNNITSQTGTNSPGSLQDNSGRINYFPYSNYTFNGTTYPAYGSSSSARPRRHRNALWFKTSNAGVANYGRNHPLWIQNPSLFDSSRTQQPQDQPLLVPVLQIQYPFANTGDNIPNLQEGDDVFNDNNNWIQQATDTETNLIFAQGDTPARPTESNGGLENFVRYLERWKGIRHIAQGAFIQFKRSSYATAPWWVFEEAHTNANNGFSPSGTIFGYPQGYRSAVTNVGNLGRSPFYAAPNRFWGYDVALLTQLPDLFSQRFASPATNAPNEYFREVSRDDRWVKPLLCAVQDSPGGYNDGQNRLGDSYRFAISKDQRPSDCNNI